MPSRSLALELVARIKALRREAKITKERLEEQLVLGPGWVTRFESGEVVPSIDMIAAMLHALDKSFGDLVADWEAEEPTTAIERDIRAEEDGKDLVVHFRYAEHDATYLIKDATLDQFTEIVRVLRDGLSGSGVSEADEDTSLMSDAVASAFLRAIELWPHVNPSDVWYFIILRAFCDPYNHDARFVRKDFAQSWKRTGGWALEKVFVDYYRGALKKHGINMYTGTKEQKTEIIRKLGLPARLEADKVDIVLTADTESGEKFFGVVHVKASIAERRTDDVPMSQVLINAGLTSPLLTMDCKATPDADPTNRGELGRPTGSGRGRVSAKRKDVEDDRLFSACFSYNTNTIPTPKAHNAAARIYVLDFDDPDDDFVTFIVAEWERIRDEQEKMLSRARRDLESGKDVS